MRAFVRFRLDHGEVRELGPGDIIGRSWTSALALQDPAVSEAHAMVSLRGSSLKLLGLRGRFAVADKAQSEVELVPGMRIQLTRDIALEVVDLVLPAEVLALEGDGLARQILGGVSALRVRPRPELVPGVLTDADATFFSDGLAWMVRFDGGGQPGASEREVRPLVAGDSFELHGRTFRAVGVALGSAGHAVTAAIGGLEAPIHLIVRYDTVHIHRSVEPSLALDGISARILSELATIKLPIGWEAIAKDIWPDEDDTVALRRKWDTSLARLRRKLRDHRIRPDLVRADGTGNFELFLLKEDRVDDQT
ncbi:MAG: hypothetical protein U1F43_14885 [Myxococcota bacterium]